MNRAPRGRALLSHSGAHGLLPPVSKNLRVITEHRGPSFDTRAAARSRAWRTVSAGSNGNEPSGSSGE
jgi:hypothetical protein